MIQVVGYTYILFSVERFVRSSGFRGSRVKCLEFGAQAFVVMI